MVSRQQRGARPSQAGGLGRVFQGLSPPTIQVRLDQKKQHLFIIIRHSGILQLTGRGPAWGGAQFGADNKARNAKPMSKRAIRGTGEGPVKDRSSMLCTIELSGSADEPLFWGLLALNCWATWASDTTASIVPLVAPCGLVPERRSPMPDGSEATIPPACVPSTMSNRQAIAIQI